MDARGLKTGLPKIAAQRDFWERGAAGAAGKAASAARRLPWRLGATRRRGEKPPPVCRAILRGNARQVSPLTKPKQRDPDRKRVSHHICVVKALANTSVYWLRALPCICGNLPACDCFAP